MPGKDLDGAWTKSLNCVDGLHAQCKGCPRCDYENHNPGSEHKYVSGRKAVQESKLSMNRCDYTGKPSPALDIEQRWNPYDNRWERLD